MKERKIGKIPENLVKKLVEKGAGPAGPALAVLLFTGCGGVKDNEINIATSTPSAAVGTPTPRSTETPTTIPVTEIDQKSINDTELAKLRLQSLQSIEELIAIRIIQTPEEAAGRFGADSYSKNPGHWKITRFGAELIPNPDGTLTNLKSGDSLLTGKINNEVNLVFPPNASNIFVKEGVVWNHPTDSIAIDQSRAETFWVGPYPARPEEFIPLAKQLTRNKAAESFGDDEYSKNPNNWFINEYGGATLQPNPNGENSKLHSLTGGAIVEGWWKVEQSSENTNFGAIAFVTGPDIGDVVLDGGTIWTFTQPEAGSAQLFWQLKDTEQTAQPGVPVYPLRNYLPVTVCIPSY